MGHPQKRDGALLISALWKYSGRKGIRILTTQRRPKKSHLHPSSVPGGMKKKKKRKKKKKDSFSKYGKAEHFIVPFSESSGAVCRKITTWPAQPVKTSWGLLAQFRPRCLNPFLLAVTEQDSPFKHLWIKDGFCGGIPDSPSQAQEKDNSPTLSGQRDIVSMNGEEVDGLRGSERWW